MASVSETIHIGVPVPVELRAELQRLAEKHERSLAAEARIAIRAHVDAAKADEGKAA